MTKRESALQGIKIAAYHADDRAVIRLYIENRVSRAAMEAARDAGIRARESGTPCTCYTCTRAA